MALLEFGCRCLTLPYLKELMNLLGYPGDGLVAALCGVVLLAYGRFRADDRTQRLGGAILIALLSVAIVTTAMKYGLRQPRPVASASFGFPSGDSATAFSLASSAGIVYPSAAPFLFLVATFTAFSRLYFRAHFVWDVLGGALIGSACGFWAARKLLPRLHRDSRRFSWSVGWLFCVLLWIGVPIFFWLLERQIEVHKLPPGNRPRLETAALSIEFGTPQARQHFLTGWSNHRVWPKNGESFNWAEGRKASILVPLTEARDSRLELRAYPYRPEGFLCQRAQITINGNDLVLLWLEQDWQDYRLEVPSAYLRTGDNRIDFTFAYSSDRNWHGMNSERRPLSVALRTLHLIPLHER